MPSNEAAGAKREAHGVTPTLPPNVFIFSPANKSIAKVLQTSLLFTRLTVGAQTQPNQLKAALADERIHESFCFSQGNAILIFDAESEGKDVQDAHHDHFRAVCLALKDHDVSLSVSSCVHDATTAVQAGFQFEELSDGSIMVVDIMGGEDDDEDEDDSDEDGEIQFLSVDEDVEPAR